MSEHTPSRRHLPYGRAWDVATRTVHIAAIGILLGGHVFDQPADTLLPFLWLSIASGAALMAIQMYPTLHWVHQGCALALFVKLALVCAVPFAWSFRVPILLVVLGIASVSSHAPRRFRHYSVIFKRVMVD
jgi:hypothetical protein